MHVLGAFGVFALLIQRVRTFLARVFPLQPHSTWHAFVLGFSWLLFTSSLAARGAPEPPQFAISLPGLLGQETVFAAVALFGAGLGIDRPLRYALTYLGVYRPRFADVRRALLATFAIYGLVAVVAVIIMLGKVYILGQSIEDLTGDPPATVEALESVLTPAALLYIPTIVAIGEEFLFRGLLQPILGLFASATLFTVVHLPQNAFDPLSFALLVPAFALGYLRRTYNTTTAILTHVFYNSGLLTLAYIGTNAPRFIAMIM